MMRFGLDGMVSAFCFVFLSVFPSLFSTFRSKVLMKGGGYVTGGLAPVGE
jgi:hypothetical protein